MPVEMINGGGGYGWDDGSAGGFPTNEATGGGINFSQPPPLVGENKPTQQFDVSVLAGLRPSDKYLGRNRVSDIQEAYQTYVTGSPIGRGGQYAVDAARRYGTTITEAARGYLVAAGLPTLASILPNTGGNTGGGNTGGGGTLPDDSLSQDEFEKRLQQFALPFVDLKENIQKLAEQNASNNSPLQQLIDVIPKLFGGAVYNPPLQNQVTDYTPRSITGSAGGGGGSNIFTWLILAGVAIGGYFLYKKFKG